MKCLTICQPYADLILLPESHPAHKRAENRRWFSRHVGPLLIHAGKSRDWLEEDEGNPSHDIYGIKISGIIFGAILGVVDQVACYSADCIRTGAIPSHDRWLMSHQHVEGPYCHVYQNVRRFEHPIPYKGAQGYFDVPESFIDAAINDYVVEAPDRKGK